ncbi:MAG: GNAT family N-acetyltransferase [Rhodanobacteraceae bacterium]
MTSWPQGPPAGGFYLDATLAADWLPWTVCVTRSLGANDMTGQFTHRLATIADMPELKVLLTLAIRKFIAERLDAMRVEASFEIMGVDTQLIEDGTYFVVEFDGRIAGSGGWSRRATMFGGDHTVKRDARLLDPECEPARVRAMYTHPDYARRGIGTLVLSLCEAAAACEGFQMLELVATVAGEPLYVSYGFSLAERIEVPTSTGVAVPCARMTMPITPRS